LIGSPAPDFGGVNFIEIMNLIEMMDIQKMGPAWDSSETALKMLQAISLTTAENIIGRYTGKLPSTEKLISKEYAEERFGKLKGKPTSLAEMMGLSTPPPGSNHLTVTDAEGNVATVLHSCMSMPYSNGLYVDGLWICAAGVHYGSGLPKPGERINARILPHMFLKNGKPVLAGGSPSVSLMENMVQNSTNILDFGLSIEEAVNKPRFGGSSMGKAGAMLWEANMPEAAAATLRKTGLQLDVVNPWNWSHGSYDSIAFDSTGMAYGCGDPRRTAMALAV
uniref:gamma-glutamyltransferase n=1 Tax=Litorivivens sp. TaxID=2020868 RepID=UPI00356A6FC1